MSARGSPRKGEREEGKERNQATSVGVGARATGQTAPLVSKVNQ